MTRWMVGACGDGLVEDAQEADERLGVVPGDRVGQDLAGVHVEGGGDGAVADVLELSSGTPARVSGPVGVFAGEGGDAGSPAADSIG